RWEIRSSEIIQASLIGPRQPETGRRNFATSRSVNGPVCRRARRIGDFERVASTRAPDGSSRARRPSHHSTAENSGFDWEISTPRREVGLTTRGLENRAWAEIGTRMSASTSGQTMGPPAENEYAVEPVGVARMTPSQPKEDTGRASTP